MVRGSFAAKTASTGRLWGIPTVWSCTMANCRHYLPVWRPVRKSRLPIPLAIAISAMWRQVLGVETTLTNQEWKVFLDTRDKKDFQISRAGWIGDYPDPINFLDMFESTAGNRRGSSMVA